MTRPTLKAPAWCICFIVILISILIAACLGSGIALHNYRENLERKETQNIPERKESSRQDKQREKLAHQKVGTNLSPIHTPFSIDKITYSPNGKLLIATHCDWVEGNQTFIWDACTHELLSWKIKDRGSFQNPILLAIPYPGTSNFIVASENHVYIACRNGTTMEINPDSAIEYVGQLRDIAISPNSSVIAVAVDNTVSLWNIQTRHPIGEPIIHDPREEENVKVQGASLYKGIVKIAFSRNGKYIVTVGTDGQARFWNVDSQKLAARPIKEAASTVFSIDGCLMATRGSALYGHSDAPAYVGSDPYVVRVWNMLTGQQTSRSIHLPIGCNILMDISPDHKNIVTESIENSDDSAHTKTFIQAWNSITARMMGGMISINGRLSGHAFSPDGMLFAICSTNDIIQFWDVSNKDWRKVGIDKICKPDTRCCAFSPDGRTFAVGHENGLSFWNVPQSPSQSQE